MIRPFVILVTLQICWATAWNLNSSVVNTHISKESFDSTSSNKNDEVLFDRFNSDEDAKQAASNNWDYDDSHNWNQISGSSDDKKFVHGLDTWLADVVIGPGYKGLVKPIIKEIAYPVYKNVKIEIPYPQVQQLAQPYPVLVPMLHPVPYEVIKTIVKTIEKKVPTPVEKIVPYPVEKPVPFEVVKHVPMFVEKKIPIRIPVYKTIHHRIHS